MKTLMIFLKKDLQLFFSGKLFLGSLAMLIIFSLYINFIYAALDTAPPAVAVYGENTEIQDLITVLSPESLSEQVAAGSADIGIDTGSEKPVVYLPPGGSRTDSLYSAYALITAKGSTVSATTMISGAFDREAKNRREITNEILFFEIVTISFLGIASLLFKEKSLGVIRLHGILPVRRYGMILSKVIVFLAADLLYAALLIMINIGPAAFPGIFPAAVPHICIISCMIALLGLIFAMLFRDFKQFAISFSIILLLLTTPVFLGGNRTMDWQWLQYYPVYHLFVGLKQAFFGSVTTSIFYYAISGLVIAALGYLSGRLLKKEIARG